LRRTLRWVSDVEMILFVAWNEAERGRIRSPKDIREDDVRLQAKVVPLAAQPSSLFSYGQTTCGPQSVALAHYSISLPYEDNAALLVSAMAAQK
jgi:hypothetical protein